jgi:farnesol dehydrogenase
MKVLLTGGTGFLGRSVARALSEAGHELRLLARATSDLSGLPRAEIVQGDVTDPASLERPSRGCGAIVHLAGLVKTWVPEPERFDAVNVGGLRNVLAAAQAVAARVVYTSSFIALGPTSGVPADETGSRQDPRYRNDYERTKSLADGVAREAAAAGHDIVIVYPGVVYGPGALTDANLVTKMVADHLSRRLPGIVGPGDRVWSYAFVEDVARGHVQALERGARGGRYFLCGDNATLVQLFDAVRALTGAPVPTRHIPYAAAAGLGFLLYLWAELTGHPPQFTHHEVGVFREHWAFSSARAERELGYRVTPLHEGLRRTVEWLRETRNA